ncbi:MAG: alpha-L-glutamate ligase [Candidatus Peregrinibacteria bacterium GW2011_GWA2_47_7]|nr:MAG: alpha-L-glutamate ligase [Candidatus Peregrinibacteria bacterium GW2011_GWA2_47_7]
MALEFFPGLPTMARSNWRVRCPLLKGVCMKIGILCFTPLGRKLFVSDLLLKKTARLLGHQAVVLRSDRFQFLFDKNQPRFFYKEKKLSRYDAIIVRPGMTTDIDLKISVIKQLQLAGHTVINTYLPIARAKNKLRTLQILNHEKIPVPRTVVISSMDHLDYAVSLIGQFPIIMKAPYGLQGAGVVIFETKRSFVSATDFLSSIVKNNVVIMQEYVREAKGKDIRIFVVGNAVVAAMERKAKKGEFRANFHLGGSIQVADLREEERKFAIQATRALGLDYAGVDILRTNDGAKVLEVNSCPGLEGISQATGINVAEHIIKYAVKKALLHK